MPGPDEERRAADDLTDEAVDQLLGLVPWADGPDRLVRARAVEESILSFEPVPATDPRAMSAAQQADLFRRKNGPDQH